MFPISVIRTCHDFILCICPILLNANVYVTKRLTDVTTSTPLHHWPYTCNTIKEAALDNIINMTQ